MSIAKISSKILRPWPVNTTCKVEIYKIYAVNPAARFALNGQSYLCDRKNKPWGTSPNTEKAKETNSRQLGQTAPPERPDKSLRTRHGSKFSGTATREGQRLSRCGPNQEYRYILPAPATVRPRTSESTPVRGSNGGVRCARMSDPMNDRATTLCASQRQMTVPTDEEARRRKPLTGATAIPRVDYGVESHCASPTISGAFTLPKQCQRLRIPNCC